MISICVSLNIPKIIMPTGNFFNYLLSTKYTLLRKFGKWKIKTWSWFFNWAAKQQTSWVIAPWWFSVSPWRICITFFWPRGSLKLTAPSSRSERHLRFASLDTWSVQSLDVAIFVVLQLNAPKETTPFFPTVWELLFEKNCETAVFS